MRPALQRLGLCLLAARPHGGNSEAMDSVARGLALDLALQCSDEGGRLCRGGHSLGLLQRRALAPVRSRLRDNDTVLAVDPGNFSAVLAMDPGTDTRRALYAIEEELELHLRGRNAVLPMGPGNDTEYTLYAMGERPELHLSGNKTRLLRYARHGMRGPAGASSESETIGSVVKDFFAPRLSLAIVFLALVAASMVSLLICAFSGRKSTPSRVTVCGHSVWAAVFALCLLATVAGGLFSVWYLSGALLKEVIEHFDMAFIGTEVTLDTVKFNPYSGHFKAMNTTIYNPEGYTCSCLMQADLLAFDLSMGPFLLSLGRHVVVNNVLIDGVHVNYERSWTSSNVGDVLDYLNAEGSGHFKVIMHRLSVSNIHARATTMLLNGLGVTAGVKDIEFADFAREAGGMGAVGILKRVISTILNSSVQAVARSG
uniref:Uncharacterized protein n=1 Tax=Alexandrium monilatum TaxID=311494 RepID=A0A7S4V8E8_9DINO|mmetsp:Transcript_1141/g.3552  ORF Transcript_1141/g.3552 Transcript_1141/m.3552 type:complete len:427 (-) Transcript_1141:41-1321(-)